ncbi:uncharacterized protein C2orf42 homolog [Salarias fasciatus]|uniref:Putative treble-clef zinc-finger domain-containing protein n=1 Tax=Salarias fasciatus TaxID=181472 RepID=A0A672HTA6_SALFA|nr:uncharacterized protein C2orf42 homolog [Salarias fasciatus]
MEAEVTVSSSSTVVSPPAAQVSTNPSNNVSMKQRDGSKKPPSTTPAFLSNLGRATLRGIRKCPQCGVYNGTRGLSCKNKACGVSLRNASSTGRGGKKCAVEAVKVIIDSEERWGKDPEAGGGDGGGGGMLGGASAGAAQVFSVCHRGRGATATQWGFVELVPTDTAIATGDGATLLTRINLGRCFLSSCRQGQRSSQGEPESSKQSSENLCVHIKQAIECRSRATPLTLKSSVLEGLQASIQAKEELWRLATESPGPLVQRVSKDTLVVKCHTESQHPLGLLHLTVGAGGLSAEGSKSVFHCACQASAKRLKPSVEGGGSHAAPLPSPPPPPPGSITSQLCLHFYACVCAFASDEKLTAEFAAFISHTSSDVQQNSSSRTLVSGEKPPQQVEPVSALQKAKKLRLENSVSGSAQVVDERAVTMSFHQWLAGVTERIHQTMHYQCDGKPQPLVFHITLDFFNALQQRLSLGSKKRRLPNITTALVRNDCPPLGPFSKYTWHITNILHVKRIFDTPELALEITQSFVKNADGSYSHFRCPEPLPEPDLPEGFKTERPQAIRPMEFRTFLKVGPSSEQKEACPFVIEWIPDVLPRCHMGELRLSFEFGHQQSGQPESFDKAGAAEKGSRNKSECGQSKLSKVAEMLQVVM